MSNYSASLTTPQAIFSDAPIQPESSALGSILGLGLEPEDLVSTSYLTDAPFDEAEIEPWEWDEGYELDAGGGKLTDEEIMRFIWLDRMERAGIVHRVQPTPAPLPPPGPYTKKPIPSKLRWAVFRRDDYRCVKCGADEDLTADHIHAEVKGGKATIGNLQTLCRSCNSKKGAK